MNEDRISFRKYFTAFYKKFYLTTFKKIKYSNMFLFIFRTQNKWCFVCASLYLKKHHLKAVRKKFDCFTLRMLSLT